MVLPGQEIPRHRLKPGDPPFVPTRSPDYQCLRCAKVYERGDRFVQVFRAEGVARDENKVPAMRCSEGFETAHVDCKDPKMNGVTPLVFVT